ncbi:uncharacterized protein I303_103401 [Kwoniella dejecticola CBS 10117]|uniref:Uncharacterized protein n=1 Tax=Kwoniella dejecticola CBS 10117 TaxID=1296121 RepID=A0A1A6A6N3_9TREE|nr:uncharacterized protein I303_03424 [Kwoniella dejecticola CBS 10117]OBR85713.1 hypothetical protein I303_03424 [Kwoniella dejecticola CBS 10117]
MSALLLNNAVPLKSPSTIKTTLPSFDDLLRSLEDSSTSTSTATSHHSPHHHHHNTYHPHHHAPYGHPYLHHRLQRPPSTPPTPTSLSSESTRTHAHHHPHHGSARHRRSNSVPSISRTHLKSPFRELHCLPQSVEHHTNRIKSLKEGDGEWAPYSLNAVTPSSLPYHARPHYHPRSSTGSIPITTSTMAPTPTHLHMGEDQSMSVPKSCSPLHHPHHSTQYPYRLHDQTPTQTAGPGPIQIPARPSMHNRTASMSISHSPLSTSEPLTPSSIFGGTNQATDENTTTNVSMKSTESREDESIITPSPSPGPVPCPALEYGISSTKKNVYTTSPTNINTNTNSTTSTAPRDYEKVIEIPTLPKLF